MLICRQHNTKCRQPFSLKSSMPWERWRLQIIANYFPESAHVCSGTAGSWSHDLFITRPVSYSLDHTAAALSNSLTAPNDCIYHLIWHSRI